MNFNIKKKLLCVIGAVSISLNGFSSIQEEHLKRIEDTFINHSESKGYNVIKINVDNYLNVTDKEKEELTSLEGKADYLDELISDIKENKWNNDHFVFSYQNNYVFLYANDLKPSNFQKNICGGMALMSTLNECLNNYPMVKVNLETVLKDNAMYLNSNYIADFLYIHELAHLMPESNKIPEFDVANVYLDELDIHYKEIYSDLFAVIFLNNYLKYDLNEIQNIITLRNMKLQSNLDLIHYSVPYIEALIQRNDWKESNSFEDISNIISDVYATVNNNNIISKKRYKNIFYQYVNFCNDFNPRKAQSKNIINIFSEFCENAK